VEGRGGREDGHGGFRARLYRHRQLGKSILEGQGDRELSCGLLHGCLSHLCPHFFVLSLLEFVLSSRLLSCFMKLPGELGN
jgi:hypothetical protein